MRFLAFLTFLLFCVFTLFARYYFVCDLKQLCAEEEIVEDIRLKTLRLTEGDSTILQGYDQFVFDSSSVSPRLNDDSDISNTAFLDTLASILKLDSTKNLAITGFFRPSEKDMPGDFLENLGLERANSIRKMLEARGVSEDRMTLDHGVSPTDTLSAPITFDLYLAGEPDEFERLQFTFTNMTISDANFEFDSDVFRPGEPFVLYADSVKTYLELNPDKSLTIIGHTDNKGKDWYNNKLGKRRAESAREYFEELGVRSKIVTKSEGEKRPVASNNTDAGRQKNRRVNFVLE